MLYIHNEITRKPRQDLNSIAYKSKELESVFVEIINPRQKNTIIGCIYRHPCMDLEEFNDEVLSILMEKIGREGKNIFLLGDFNVNLMNSPYDIQTGQFFDILTSNLMVPHITLPTRITTSSTTLIDNIFSNSLNFRDGVSGNLTSKMSDHYAQFLIIASNCYKVLSKHNQYKRDTKNFDRDNFILDLLDIDILENELNKLLDKYMPLKKLTLGIRNSMKRRDKTYKKFIKAKNTLLKNEYHKEYKDLRNQIVSLCRDSKKKYFQNFFAEMQTMQEIYVNNQHTCGLFITAVINIFTVGTYINSILHTSICFFLLTFLSTALVNVNLRNADVVPSLTKLCSSPTIL